MKLISEEFIPTEYKDAYDSLTGVLLKAIDASMARVNDLHQIRVHGDCHSGNILWRNEAPHFVDFDDSRTGPAVQDLWMLLAGDRGAMTRQLADVLAGYEDFFEFDTRELHLLEALRTLRLIHYSAWLAQRWDDPAFPAAFPWFDSPRYWEERILELREQIALMEEPPLWSS